jgi:hypothetical protein
MHSKKITRTTATAIAAVLLAGTIGVPGVSARMPADRVPAGGWPDMHASTAQALAKAHKRQDLRSADARDAAAGRGTFSAPDVAVVKLPESSAQPAPASSDGLDWTDAGIGAGGALTMVLLAAGGAVAVGHRRRGGTGVPTV